MKTKAVYAGSFDPFTNGHLEVYNQAKEIFDEVIILIASNPGKTRSTDSSDMVDAIKDATNNNQVYYINTFKVFNSKLVADFCKEVGCKHLIRGLRNTSDYMYEEMIAKVNEAINPDIRTVYFRAKDDVISSSMIRLFLENGKDVSMYVPAEVLKIL